MESQGELPEDYREILVNYAMRHLLGSDKGRYIIDALMENDPLNHGYVMLEATRRLQKVPRERLEKPEELIRYLENLQVERARRLMGEAGQ